MILLFLEVHGDRKISQENVCSIREFYSEIAVYDFPLFQVVDSAKIVLLRSTNLFLGIVIVKFPRRVMSTCRIICITAGA